MIKIEDNSPRLLELLSGAEKFTLKGKDIGLTVKDFWQFQFSSLMDNLGYVAEFLVAKALEKNNPENSIGWTVYDLTYGEMKIEVKTTSYYHSFNPDGFTSEQRVFSIRKTHTKYKNVASNKERQNDIYIFCVDTGRTRETANPLNLDCWDFYVVPTSLIDKFCKDQKTVSLNRIQNITGMKKGISYNELKDAVDQIIEKEKHNNK